MLLKSTGFNFFAKKTGENYAFCCSSHISFNPSLLSPFVKNGEIEVGD